MTINTLADRYAAAKELLSEQEDIVKALKAEIVALGVVQVEGRSCFVNVSLGSRKTLDAKAVVSALGQPWVDAHTKEGKEYEILNIEAKPVKALVAKALAELEDAAGF
jgi:hypothetical protein